VHKSARPIACRGGTFVRQPAAIDFEALTMPRPSFPPRRPHLLAWALAVALTGCGKVGGPSSAKAVDVQVAARVNDDDITIHQVQYAVQRMRLPVDGADAAARRALDQLIEQELSAQAARADGLDREPMVVQALEAARREVLARAWQDRLAAPAVRASSDEIDRYYAEHPGLFARRRIYVLQELAVDAKESQFGRVEQIAGEATNPRDVLDKLEGAGFTLRARRFAQSAEDLPIALVEPISALDVGRSIVVPSPSGPRVYTVMHAVAAPVDRRAANDAIDAYMLGERKRRAVADGMKPIRDKARVEYRGSFAKAASAPGGTR